MYCPNCGATLIEGAKFCANCGSTLSKASPASGASSPKPAGKRPSRSASRKKPGLLIGIAAIVVVALVVALVASGIFGGAKGKVAKAVNKSYSAYTSAAEKAKLPNAVTLVQDGKFGSSLSLSLESMPGNTTLDGLGIRLNSGVDLDGQQAFATLTPFYGSADLVNVQLAVDKSEIFVTSPELTEGAFYGVDTLTLGQNLVALGADLPRELENLGFNVFELLELLEKYGQPDKAAVKELKESVSELYKAITVEKIDSKTLNINRNKVKCAGYHVVIPQDELEDCLDALEDCVDSVDYEDLFFRFFTALGISERGVDDLMDKVDYLIPDLESTYDDTFDGAKEFLDALGDVELDVYLKGGYVMAVTYDEKIDGFSLELELLLGGGDNYVDNLSLTLSADDELEITISSSGDHSAKGGVFTDETVIKLKEFGFTQEVLSSAINYEPGADTGNFSWDVALLEGSISVEAEGQLDANSKSISFALDNISVKQFGSTLAELEANWTLGNFTKEVKVSAPTMLADMTEDDLEDLVSTIRDNALGLVEDLLGTFPALFYLF